MLLLFGNLMALKRPRSSRLRVHIDLDWRATDLIESLQCFEYLYNLRLYLDDVDYYIERYSSPIREDFYDFIPFATPRLDEAYFRRYSDTYHSQRSLAFKRCQYGSEGSFDLFGIGDIMSKIGEWTNGIYYRKENAEKKQEEVESLRLRNGRFRIENARAFQRLQAESLIVERLKQEISFADHSEEIERKSQTILRLLETGHITGFSNLENEMDEE